MNQQKVIWATSFSEQYYNDIFSKISESWNNIHQDIKFYLDHPIKNFLDQRSEILPFHGDPPRYLKGNEIKFWKKAKSFMHFIDQAKESYDYAIWLDADVEVLSEPDLSKLLPTQHEAISANSKVPRNGTSIDTGFVAVNLKYDKINDWVDAYKKSWRKEILEQFPLKYDTFVIEKVLSDQNHKWKNLWHGKITKGKSYCGFEDSDLDLYFRHYWGKRNKENI